MPRIPIARQLENYEVHEPTGCWLWTKGLNGCGYGYLANPGGSRLAHRHAYEQVHGPIPEGGMICHRCDNPSCINPDHLFLGDAASNAADMVAKGRASKGPGSSNPLPVAVKPPPAPWKDCRACDGEGVIQFPVDKASDETVAVPCKCPLRPKVRRTFKRVCSECAVEFRSIRPDAVFCCVGHKTAYHNRSAKRGKVLIPVALAWRGGKSKKGDDTGKAAFGELCRVLDRYNEEDRKAGRQPAFEFYRRQLRQQVRERI